MPLDVGRADLLRIAGNYLVAYCYYSGGGIAVCGILAKIGYAKRLNDAAVNPALTKRVANCEFVWMPSIGAKFRFGR